MINVPLIVQIDPKHWEGASVFLMRLYQAWEPLDQPFPWAGGVLFVPDTLDPQQVITWQQKVAARNTPPHRRPKPMDGTYCDDEDDIRYGEH